MNPSAESPAAVKPSVRTPLLRLLLFGLMVSAGILTLLWMGSDWQLWAERLARLHPALFLAAMALLPVIGFPISAFYFYAGVVYGWAVGIPLSLTAIAINMSLSYLVARTLLRGPISDLIRRRGLELPRVKTPANQFRVTLLLRTVPGPPYAFQNYLLALAGVPFHIYLPISLAVQGVIGGALVVSSSLLTLHIEPWLLISGALLLFLAAGIGGSIFYKRREKGSPCPE